MNIPSSMPMPVPMQMAHTHMAMNGHCDMDQMMPPMQNFAMKWEPCTPPDEKPPAHMLFPPLPGMFNQSRHSSNGEDYHGSSSGSPSSSLSSPNEFKDEPLGLDINFSSSLFNTPFSPSATSSHSPSYGMLNSAHAMAPQQHSPLPPVAHFSHNHHLHHHHVIHPQNLQMNMNTVFANPGPQYVPGGPSNCFFKDPSIYDGQGGMGLAAAQQQLKARNKMHEMALRQHLISDQNIPTTNGDLVLSAEERRTLLQEGYPVPTKYPLSKSEEESLKIVRRKIKNKLSAQESRRKRKEYIDALESRLHCFSEENKALKQQVHQLEASNRDLQQKLHQYESKEKR